MAAERLAVGLVPRVYPLLVEAIEAGVAYGWRHGWKHRDGEPDEQTADTIREEIESAVVSELLERFAICEPDREEGG